MRKKIRNFTIAVAVAALLYFFFKPTPVDQGTVREARPQANSIQPVVEAPRSERLNSQVTDPYRPSAGLAGGYSGEQPELPEDLRRQLEAPKPEIPADLQRQLDSPSPELPEDLRRQLEEPPPPVPDDIRQALQVEPRTVPIEEVNQLPEDTVPGQ